jgi:hypothetical protein
MTQQRVETVIFALAGAMVTVSALRMWRWLRATLTR